MKAGRKSISRVDRLLIGAYCDAESDKSAEAVALRKHKAALPYSDIEKSRADLNKVALGKRERISDKTDEDLAWISETLKRHRLLSFKTPQSIHESIFKQVAKEASELFGVTITPRQVRRWRDEYRALCKQQRAQS